MNAPREIAVQINVVVGDRLAAKLAAITNGQAEAGTYPATVRVLLRPVEELLLVNGAVTEAELQDVYAAAIEAGQRVAYHY